LSPLESGRMMRRHHAISPRPPAAISVASTSRTVGLAGVGSGSVKLPRTPYRGSLRVSALPTCPGNRLRDRVTFASGEWPVRSKEGRVTGSIRLLGFWAEGLFAPATVFGGVPEPHLPERDGWI
jgi:hypothetical protein